MRTPVITTILLNFILSGTVSSLAVTRGELDNNRIRLLSARFEAMPAGPKKCFPAEILRPARGFIQLDRTKAGLLFACQGGGGATIFPCKSGMPCQIYKVDNATYL